MMSSMDFEIKIINGRIFDGSGAPEFAGDIGINKDSIAEVGDLANSSTAKNIDAKGLIICPGFIDAHSHSDVYLLIEPSAASKIYQGITTEIGGNCGASAAPLHGTYKMPADWCNQLERLTQSAMRRAQSKNTDASPTAPPRAPRAMHHTPNWRGVAEYRTLYSEIQPAINMALLVGHNTLHAGICGYEPRGATCDELRRMNHELERALDEGAIGLSSGLAYPPGSAVPREELIALAKTAAQRGGLYTTHMRSESNGLLEAIDEAIDIAEQADIPLHISHLKASGSANWNKLESALEKIRRARELHSRPISADRYPYTAGSTDLDILLPQWATYGGRDAILARIRDPKTRAALRAALADQPDDYWDNVMVGLTTFEAFKGKFLLEIAQELNMEPVDAFLHLIDVDELKTGGVFFSMSESNLQRVLAEPYVSIGSDGSMRAPWGPLSTDHPHPRAYGSHSRFLRMALDGQTVPLAEAIYKMTGLPAEQFGLKNRGRLIAGYAADLVIFDPNAICEKSTYATPHQLSEGIRHVFVNGVHSLADGRHTAQRAGQFLAR
ncbi:MAG: D-aminoacylase [Pontiellaceae bacterium]|nr:D-aminoacylase [Pontiellaceae bacterium]